MPPTTAELWAFLPLGYSISVLIETPFLVLGLSPHHSLRTRIVAGVWLTACTYPIVVLVLPQLVWIPFGRTAYITVAELFAPTAECLLFYLGFARQNWSRRSLTRDFACIVAANLASFLFGLFLFG